MKTDMHRTGRSLRVPDGRAFPIVEPMLSGTIVFLSERHVLNGVQKDPWNCAIANSACETMGATAAMIGATIAYVVVKMDGEFIALRLGVPTPTRRAIEEFDRTGRMPAEGFRFSPVRPSDRSDSKRASNKRNRHRWGVDFRPATGNRGMKVRDVRSASHKITSIATKEDA